MKYYSKSTAVATIFIAASSPLNANPLAEEVRTISRIISRVSVKPLLGKGINAARQATLATRAALAAKKALPADTASSKARVNLHTHKTLAKVSDQHNPFYAANKAETSSLRAVKKVGPFLNTAKRAILQPRPRMWMQKMYFQPLPRTLQIISADYGFSSTHPRRMHTIAKKKPTTLQEWEAHHEKVVNNCDKTIQKYKDKGVLTQELAEDSGNIVAAESAMIKAMKKGYSPQELGRAAAQKFKDAVGRWLQSVRANQHKIDMQPEELKISIESMDETVDLLNDQLFPRPKS